MSILHNKVKVQGALAVFALLLRQTWAAKKSQVALQEYTLLALQKHLKNGAVRGRRNESGKTL